MSDELKACPFCGKTAYKAQAKRIIHSCNAINVSMSREHWQSRPIEDALRKQLDESNRKLEQRIASEIDEHLKVVSLQAKLDGAREAIRDDVLILLHEIQSSQKGSIGSIDNIYLPQMSRRNIDAMEKRINNALAEINRIGGMNVQG